MAIHSSDEIRDEQDATNRAVGADSALIIRWSRWRQAAMMALGSGFVALAIAGWPSFHEGWDGIPGPVLLACGAMMFVVGALAFGLATVRLVTAAVTGRIDGDGIYWARWSARTIPWSAIEAYSIAPHPTEGYIKVVNLWLAEPAAWMPDGRVQRWFNRSRLTGYGHVTLDFRGTDCTVAQAVDRLGAEPSVTIVSN